MAKAYWRPWRRFAGVMAFAFLANVGGLVQASADNSPAAKPDLWQAYRGPMTFTAGRLPGSQGCGLACADFIVADGEIGLTSSVSYLLVHNQLKGRKAILLLDSPGGVRAGMVLLLRMWRHLGVTAVVARARARDCSKVGDDCSEADLRDGVRVFDLAADKAACESACPLALMGAPVRIIPDGARVGVHSPRLDTSRGPGKMAAGVEVAAIRSISRNTEADFGALAQEMGVSREVARRAARTAAHLMDYLSPSDLREYRLATVALEDSPLDPKLIAALSKRTEPPGDDWSRLLGDCFGGDKDRQVEACTRIIDQDSKRSSKAMAYTSRGLARQRALKFNDAHADFDEAIGMYPNDASGYDNRGRNWHKRGDLDQAMADLNKAIKLDPRHSSAFINRSAVFAERKDYTSALDDANQAVTLAPMYARAHLARGVALRGASSDEAGAAIDKAIELEPNLAEARYQRAINRIAQRDSAGALVDLDRAIELDPSDAKAFTSRAEIFAGLRDHQQALLDYNVAIRLDESHAPAFIGRGDVWADRRDFEKAHADYTNAIALNPSHAVAYNHRGLNWRNRKEFDQALADLNKAIELDRNFAFAFNNRALAWEGKGDLSKALADLNVAISLPPRHAIAYVNRARLARLTRNDAQALADVNVAISIDPNSTRAYLIRAQINAASEFERAIEDYTTAIRLDPENSVAHFGRGRVFSYLRKWQEAQADFATVVRLDGSHPYATLWLYLARRRAQSDPSSALAWLRPEGNAWPASLMRFLKGEMTEEALFAAARHVDAKIADEQICEADYYVGMQALIDNRQPQASSLLERAAKTCPINFIEREGAEAEMRVIAKTETASSPVDTKGK